MICESDNKLNPKFESIKINGKCSLQGQIRISGAKNSALVLLAASLLTKDKVYLAKRNPEFQMDKITATTGETGGEPKYFYRSFDHNSALTTSSYCDECRGHLENEYMRYHPERNKNYCFKHYPEQKQEPGAYGHSGVDASGACGTCAVCKQGHTDYCPNGEKTQRELTWDLAPPAQTLL